MQAPMLESSIEVLRIIIQEDGITKAERSLLISLLAFQVQVVTSRVLERERVAEERASNEGVGLVEGFLVAFQSLQASRENGVPNGGVVLRNKENRFVVHN